MGLGSESLYLAALTEHLYAEMPVNAGVLFSARVFSASSIGPTCHMSAIRSEISSLIHNASAEGYLLSFIQRNNPYADTVPTSCASMNMGASMMRMPENVSVSARANVTAGLAKDVEEVNQ